MPLRMYMMLLPCALLLSCAHIVKADDAEQSTTGNEVTQAQEETLMDRLNRVLDEDGKQKLDAFTNELQNLDSREDFKDCIEKIHNELEEQHGEIMSVIKENLGVDFIPLNLLVKLGTARAQEVTE